MASLKGKVAIITGMTI